MLSQSLSDWISLVFLGEGDDALFNLYGLEGYCLPSPLIVPEDHWVIKPALISFDADVP